MVEDNNKINSLSNRLIKEQIKKAKLESKKAELELSKLESEIPQPFWKKDNFLRNFVAVIIGISILCVFF